MYTLIQTKGGERILVRDLSGHRGCKVVARNVPEQPSPHHVLTAKGEWAEDKSSIERARLERMSNAELIEEVLARLESRKPTA